MQSTNLLGLDTLRIGPPPSDREAWLARRKLGLGGTDMAAILGFVPQRSAIDVWLDKTGRAPLQPDDGNERTEMGNLLEPFVAELFANGDPNWPRKGGPLVLTTTPMLVRTDRPWQIANPDRVAYEPEAVADIDFNLGAPSIMAMLRRRPAAGVEIKTHGFMYGRTYGKDGEDVDSVPDDKRVQSMWYQAALELDTWHLAALIDTHQRRSWVIHRDREAEAQLLQIGEDFWVRNVLGDLCPDPDGSASYGQFLRRSFGGHSQLMLDQRPDIDEMARAYRAAHVAEREAKTLKEAAVQKLQRAIGDSLGVVTSEGPIKWSTRRSGKLKEKELREHLYKRCGMTDAEIAALEVDFEMPNFRAMQHGRW